MKHRISANGGIPYSYGNLEERFKKSILNCSVENGAELFARMDESPNEDQVHSDAYSYDY